MRMRGPEISEFIDRLVRSLKTHEIPASPEQIIDSHDVALMLLAKRRGDVDSVTLMHSLAPIFCADPAEREVFYSDFERALETEAAGPAPPAEDADERPVKPRPPPIARLWRWSRAITKVVAFLVFMAVAAWLILELIPAPEPLDTTTIETPGERGQQQTATLPARQDDADDTVIQLLPRPPAPVVLIRPDQEHAISALAWLIAFVPLAFGFATLMRRLAGRRVFLASERTRSHPDLRPIPITEAQSGLYAYTRLASAVTRMRLPKRTETRRLDTRRTVEKTIDAGGYPSLVFQTLSKRPGYVLLIERKNAVDFFAHAARSLADYLYAAGLEIHAFAFKGRPYRFVPLWRKGHRVTYQEILQRYHGDALILAGDPGTIRRGNVAGANEWRPDISAWSATGLLSSKTCEAWDQDEDWFFEKSFSVAPFSSKGFEEISSWLSAHEPNDDEPHFVWEPEVDGLYPRALADNAERWLADETQDDTEEVLAQLESYLGEDGMYLLAAVAAYPDLRWPIARFLNQELFSGEKGRLRGEQRLLRIARLPWCREGTMPAYFRHALLSALSAEQRQTVQQAYHGLLNDTHRRDPDAPKLEIAVPGSKTFREYLQEMLSTAPPGPYRDYIFQSVLLDPPKDMLGVELSRERARKVGKQRWRLVMPEILAHARRTAIWTAVVAFVAFVYVSPIFTSAIEDRNVLANGSITARIFYYTEEAAAQTGVSISATNYLAKRLQWALEARGFNVAMESIDFSPAQQAAMLAQSLPDSSGGSSRSFGDPEEHPLSRPITPNFVFFDDRAGVSLIDNQVVPTRDTLVNRASTPMQVFAGVAADEIRFATYGQPVNLSAAGDLDPNTLLEMGHPDDAAYIDGPASINILLTEDTRSFQDRLAKGGLGPVMNVMPPGLISLPGVDPTTTRDPNPPGGRSAVFDRPFAIGKYEITFDEYDRFAAETDAALPDDSGWGRGRRPAISVTKGNAQAYADWLSDATGETYRLPTDAEWEYAARANGELSDGAFTDLQANFGGLPDRSVPVGRFPANAWGLHDMQGNVAEWVSDCWNPAQNIGSSAGDGRCESATVRNGSWMDVQGDVGLSASRARDPDIAFFTIGFRLVREFGTSPAQQLREALQEQSSVPLTPQDFDLKRNTTPSKGDEDE